MIPSSSLVPENDKSLLFTNSGMVQFKSIFLGKTEPSSILVTNSQKCVRAGGKHNDLEDVGQDSYHHTFFEMLGNWSFNYTGVPPAYFKKEAIDMAYDLLIRVYGLDPNRLYVTYFGGSESLEPDLETKELWSKHVPIERILPFGTKENFWELGDMGPCGPCTELHYDLIGNRFTPELVNQDDPTLIEIWNLVFMQYERQEDGSLIPLKMKHVDTGAGLERLTAVLQNCTNYEIDLFRNIITILEQELKGPQYTNTYAISHIDVAYRVIADHIRAMIMLINDGVTPGPVDRKYVLRRIIRRALRYGTKFEASVGWLSKTTKLVMPLLEAEYDEVFADKDFIVNTILTEETQFRTTMMSGLKFFNKLFKKNELTIDNLFRLYTTYGFPIDIIKQLCLEYGIKFDQSQYDILMNDHIEKSKSGKQFHN